MKKSRIAFLVLIFLIVFFTRYSFFSQTDTFSDDSSYYALRQIENIVDTGKPLYEDQLSYSGRTFYFTPAYHYILALFFLTKNIFLLKIINNLFASLIVVSSFLIVENITKNFFISSLIALISGFIPLYFAKTLNSLNPSSIFFPLLILLLYYISKLRLESKKYSSITTLLFFLLIIISPHSLILILGLLFNQILVKIDGNKIDKKEIEIFIVSFFFYVWYYLFIYKSVLFNHGISILKQNIPITLLADYFMTPTPINILLSIGIIPFLLGSYAVYFISTKEKMFEANILASTSIMVVLFSYFGILEFIDGIILIGVFLTIISSVSIKLIIDYFIDSKIKHLKSFVTLLIIMLIMPSVFSSLMQGEKLLSENLDLEIYKKIDSNIESGAIIIAPISSGHYISYFGKKKNVIDSNFLMFENVEQRISDVRTIYTTPFYTTAISLAFEKYGSTYILINEEARKRYNISNIQSYNEQCFKEAYKVNNDIVYQLIC